jgi:hypothetical protein
MPVPTLISSLSQTAGSNSPPGSESPTTADDYLRTYASFIAMLRDGVGFTDPVQLASAATTSIGAQNSLFVEITGTTGITSFGTTYEGPRFLRFTGALTMTHNATTLNLPTAANITTVAGDTALAVPNFAGNGWNVVAYQRADGTPLALASSQVTTAKIADANVTAAKLDGAQSGSAPIFGARAWVNYKGTATRGINGSGNVSSVTVNGTGDFTVNFTTSLPDANYAPAISYASSLGGIAAASRVVYSHTFAAGSFRFQCRNDSAALADFESICIAFFR